MHIRIAVALAVASILVGGSSPADAQRSGPDLSSQWRALSAQELYNLVISHKLGGINRFNEPYLTSFNRDGTIVAQAHPAASASTSPNNPYTYVSDTGTWSLEGDRICTQMKTWVGGTRSCWHIETNGSQYRRPEGNQSIHPNQELHLDQVPWSQGVWAWR